MGKIIVLVVIILFGLLRFLNKRAFGKPTNHLIISLFIQTIPFGYGKAIYTFLEGRMVNDTFNELLGEFGNSIRLEVSTVFFLFLVFFGYTKKPKQLFSYKENRWLYFFIFLCLISFINPINIFPLSFLPAVSLIVQLLFLLKLIDVNFTRIEIFKGIYDGIKITTYLQFFLTICFPVLGMSSVVTIFHNDADSALEWSQRRDTLSAMGTFGHPGTLALYCLISSILFLSCYLKNYRKKQSFYLILMNLFVIALTFSRTTYLASIFIILLLIIVEKQKKSIFSLKNITIFTISFTTFLIILYFTPLSDMFLKSDSDSQFENRTAHWLLGFSMWTQSYLFGVGLNDHVYYMLRKSVNTDISSDIFLFLIRSPIHSIHVIILAETGLMGFLPWVYFLFTRLRDYSKKCHTLFLEVNIFNLTFTGILLAVVIYGFLGWSPFRIEILTEVILFGYFADTLQNSKSKKGLKPY